jgi:hypothetical protein
VTEPLVLCVTAALSISCGSPVNPSVRADLAVVGGESHRVTYLNAEMTGPTAAAPFSIGPVLASAYDESSRTGYFTASSETGSELLAVNFVSNEIQWRTPIADVANPVLYDDVQLVGAPMTLLPGNSTLIMRAIHNNTIGIATFDLGTLTLGVFRGPLDVLGFSALRFSGDVAAVIKTGEHGDGRVSSSILILDPGNLHTLDSIAPAQPYEDPFLPIEAPGGDLLFTGNYANIYVYSRQQRRVLVSTERPAQGDMAVSTNGQLVVLSDGGTFPDDPGSGKLFVFHRSMQLLRVIDLTPQRRTVWPLVTSHLTFSPDGRWLYVAAGTPSIGPIYGAQPVQVLVIEATTFQVVRAIPLEDWGFVKLFPLH